jgi:hypothetical protein
MSLESPPMMYYHNMVVRSRYLVSMPLQEAANLVDIYDTDDTGS